MKFLAFDTLSGRLIWLVVATLIVSQLFFTWLYITKTSTQEMENEHAIGLRKISAIIEKLDALAPDNLLEDQQDELIAQESDEFVIFTIDDRVLNNSDSMHSAWQSFQSKLRQSSARDIKLTQGRELVSAGYRQDQVIEDYGIDFKELMIVSLPLKSGDWLHASIIDLDSEALSELLLELSFYLLSSVIMIPVIIWSVNSITSPLARLSTAAERLGNCESLGMLPLTGTQEVRSATQAFNTMNSRLQRYDKDRSQMLAAISHDLRSPLTGMKIQAEFINDSGVQAAIIEGIDEMEAMTQSVVNFLRDEAEQAPAEALSIGLFMDKIIKSYQANKQAVHWQSDTAPRDFTVSVSPDSFNRAVRNILDNALKYGQEAVVSLRQDAGFVYLDIRDQGPGIDEAQHDYIFQPFTRLDASRSQEGGGVGLGLSVARSTVRSFGGDITLNNHRERGLVVSVALPAYAVSTSSRISAVFK